MLRRSVRIDGVISNWRLIACISECASPRMKIVRVMPAASRGSPGEYCVELLVGHPLYGAFR